MVAKIHPDNPELAGCVVTDGKFCKDSATALTVWKKSLLFSCSGFTVFDPSGNIIFRVDNYCSDPRNEVVLMDAAGIALLTMRRKVYIRCLYWLSSACTSCKGRIIYN